jgi:hypothetical protein
MTERHNLPHEGHLVYHTISCNDTCTPLGKQRLELFRMVLLIVFFLPFAFPRDSFLHGIVMLPR